ncbi:trimethyltridecatetraene synthase-like [Andrographis paniculata]|uniref:trimethyltridecatetraene synthase-like n=1 Tax=Andrographis paniculata TaxID=175694 RepID=UPI0021E89CA3|nr:trimethyltridecatetraene synthase-like [Andrographis paniculata]
MEVFCALVLALASIVALAFVFNKHKPKLKFKFPPGPKPWPIIGNLNLIGSIPHQSLHFLSKKYGPIMYLKFGKFPVVVASTPEMAKEFLKNHDAEFASRPLLSAGKYTSYNYSDLTWSPYGPYWRQARKIYLSEVFSPKKMESELFEQIRTEERRDLMSRLHSLSGNSSVLLRDHVFRYALLTINRMALGQKYFNDCEDEESSLQFDEFHEMLDEWFLLGGVFNIGDWIPWLQFLDLQGYVRRMKVLAKKLDKIYEVVINDHVKMAATNNSGRKDTVDRLLELAEDPNVDVKLTRDQIKALIQNLIVGGADTTRTVMEWIVQELMRHPRVYEKAKDELNRVIGKNRWVEETDYAKLPYIEAIIIETMRLHPLATFLAPHYAMDNCRIAGYDILKGTTILINTWSIGRDPDSWDAPEEFIPERFVGKKVDILGMNFALLPFGSGRRRCPGYSLGLKSMWAITANLLHGFDLKLGDGMRHEDVSLEEVYGLTTHPKQILSIILEPTLPKELY